MVQRIRKVDLQKAQVQMGPELDASNRTEFPARAEESIKLLKLTSRESIRGKKANARSKAQHQFAGSAVERAHSKDTLVNPQNKENPFSFLDDQNLKNGGTST